jgi:hypothetical protein
MKCNYSSDCSKTAWLLLGARGEREKFGSAVYCYEHGFRWMFKYLRQLNGPKGQLFLYRGDVIRDLDRWAQDLKEAAKKGRVPVLLTALATSY